MAAPTTPPSLSIAYIGNFRHPFCTEVHISGSLRELGHRVIPLQEDRTPWSSVLKEAAGANLLLWTRTWPAEMDQVVPVLAQLREIGVPSVSYHLDRWWGLDREHQVRDQPFFHTDLVVSPDGGNDARWVEAGVNHLWMPPGVYGAECHPVAPNHDRFPAEVVFVGSHPYPHPEWEPYRTGLINAFAEHFGRRFRVYPGAGGRVVRGAGLQTLYASAKVVLGDTCLSGGATHYWSDRIPETLGRGGLLIHPWVDGIDDWYDRAIWGKGDLALYDLGNIDMAIELADYFLDDPAEARAVGEQGRATVLGRDTYTHRMTALLDKLAIDPTVKIPRPIPGRSHPMRKPSADTGYPVRLGRVRARFDPRPEDEVWTDRVVIDEVWKTNDYRIDVNTELTGTVLDIGANIGAFTILAAKLGARVYAVEPHPENRHRLDYHVQLNNVADRVTIDDAAVMGYGPALLPLLAGNGGGAHLVPDGYDEAEAPIPVRALTLAELIPAAAGPDGRIDLLKMDIEGGEFAAFALLADDDPDLIDSVERIVMEWHGPGSPHLAHLRGDELGPLFLYLADHGRVETFGHPDRGGILHWRRY